MTTIQAMALASQHVDALEALADTEAATLAQGTPQALDNLLARLRRLQTTIESAARQ